MTGHQHDGPQGAHAGREQFLRDRQPAPFGHARGAHRAGVAQHQHGVFVAIECRVGAALDHLGR